MNHEDYDDRTVGSPAPFHPLAIGSFDLVKRRVSVLICIGHGCWYTGKSLEHLRKKQRVVNEREGWLVNAPKVGKRSHNP